MFSYFNAPLQNTFIWESTLEKHLYLRNNLPICVFSGIKKQWRYSVYTNMEVLQNILAKKKKKQAVKHCDLYDKIGVKGVGRMWMYSCIFSWNGRTLHSRPFCTCGFILVNVLLIQKVKHTLSKVNLPSSFLLEEVEESYSHHFLINSNCWRTERKKGTENSYLSLRECKWRVSCFQSPDL